MAVKAASGLLRQTEATMTTFSKVREFVDISFSKDLGDCRTFVRCSKSFCIRAQVLHFLGGPKLFILYFIYKLKKS